MTVTRIGDSWYSSLTEQTYDSEMAAKHYDNLERMKSRPESEGSKLLDSLSTAQLKSLVTEMIVEAEQIQGNRDWNHAQKDFVAANPDYVPNTANGSALAAVLVERGKLTSDGVFLGTADDMQNAYLDLAEKGMLQLRKGARLPHRTDEAELYTLSAEELKRRALGLE